MGSIQPQNWCQKQPHFNGAELTLGQCQTGLTRFGPIFGAKSALLILQCTDAFDFADEIRNLSVNEDDILVSYDVTALFTNVPLDETINILVNKAFADNWFNKTHGLNLQKDQLVKLLEIATTNQLFQFDGQLNE